MLVSRCALGFLLLTGLVTGGWATMMPQTFYASFPGLGHRWVALDGPYNLHLVRDVGAAYLMIAALAALALWRPASASPSAVGVATLVFNALHLGYHATHLAMYPPTDRVLSLAALTAMSLCSLWLAFIRSKARP